MLSEGERLKGIAVKVWDSIQEKPLPSRYVRTENSIRALELGKPILQENGRYAISLSWKNDLAYHDSWVHNANGKKQPKGHAIWLISEGWNAPRLEARIGKRERFTNYKETEYLDRVIKEYQKVMPVGYTVTIDVQGKLKKLANDSEKIGKVYR